MEGLIRQRVEIDEMQCGCMSGRCTTHAIFIVRQQQKKHLAANKPLYMAFIDLEKAFDRVPRDDILWAMRKLGTDEWLVRLVQSMYKDVKSRVRVGDGYSKLSLGAAVCRRPDDQCWVQGGTAGKGKDMEDRDGEKGPTCVHGEKKIMELGINLDVLKKSEKYPCGVCLTGVGSTNAILCDGCERWVHKKCSGIKGRLLPESEFTCARCLGTARAIDGRHSIEVEVGNEKLEVVPEFCYLGDMLSAGGGCELAAITHCKCAWGKFWQLLPLLTNGQVPLLTRGKVYSSCVRSVMLHEAETWAMKAVTLNRLRRNDRAIIRWICNVKAKNEVSSDSLLTKLGIQDLDVVLRTDRMRWFGHVEPSTGWISEVRKLNVVAQKRSGRPRKSWDEVIKNDRKKLDMGSADPSGEDVSEEDLSKSPTLG